jgi:hypothetical protein
MTNVYFALTEAARPFLAEFRAAVPDEAPLEEAHVIAVQLAERLLPAAVEEGGS